MPVGDRRGSIALTAYHTEGSYHHFDDNEKDFMDLGWLSHILVEGGRKGQDCWANFSRFAWDGCDPPCP